MTIPVRFSCRLCGLKDVTVDAPARDAGVDVRFWLEQTLGHAIKREHARLSPGCMSLEISEIKIPTTGRPFIGSAIVQ